MKYTDPGEFDKWIEILSGTNSDKDGMGRAGSTENIFLSGWAAIWPASAKEMRENMRTGVNITHSIRMWYQSGVTHDMRVRYGTRIFEIKGAVNPEEKSIYLDMVCNERL